MADNEQPDVMTLTVTLLSAYFANNMVPSSELPALVEGTRKALLGDLSSSAGTYTSTAAPPTEIHGDSPDTSASEPAHVPAVSVAASLASPDHLISLIDGKRYKTLKRHLATHGLTPADYRARYDLPKDYPMTSPSFSEARRAVARAIGLGSRKAAPEQAGTVDVEVPANVGAAPAPKVRGSRMAKATAATAKPASSQRARKPRAVKPEALEEVVESKPAAKSRGKKVASSPPTGGGSVAA